MALLRHLPLHLHHPRWQLCCSCCNFQGPSVCESVTSHRNSGEAWPPATAAATATGSALSVSFVMCMCICLHSGSVTAARDSKMTAVLQHDASRQQQGCVAMCHPVVRLPLGRARRAPCSSSARISTIRPCRVCEGLYDGATALGVHSACTPSLLCSALSCCLLFVHRSMIICTATAGPVSWTRRCPLRIR